MIVDLKRLGYVLVVPELKHLLVDLSVRLKAANGSVRKANKKKSVCPSNCRKKLLDVV